jgi:asparagine synthase (glutamine-hydrolysing)
MFRYLAISWNSLASSQEVIAERFDESIRQAEGWQSVLSAPGLRVYVVGGHPGINGIYLLPSAKGVILGRLFRRRGDPSASRDIEITASEGDRILQTQGRALIDHYWGRYIAVIRFDRQGTCVLRDPSGTLPCYRCKVDGVTAVFSWLEDVISFSPTSPISRVDWNSIAAYLAIGHLGGYDTALHGVTQILPGQLTTIGEGEKSKTSIWSAVDIAKTPIDQEPEIAAAALRQVVIDCVQAWFSCHEAILLRLSGGVDSAILLGSLAAVPLTDRVTCLNYHSPGADSDERSFARLAAEQAGVTLVERERETGFRLDEVLALSRTPTPESYIGRMGTNRVDAQVADTHRVRAMFTGAGGDQLFFQARCTWPAADYLHLKGLGRGFLRATLDAARLARVSLWRSMWRAMADRRRRPSPLDSLDCFMALASRDARDVVRNFDRYVHPDLLGSLDLPIGKFHQVEDLINPFSYYDPYFSGAPELVNPLLSQPLIELCLALPTWLLTHGGRGRALARKAFARDIPREIAFRQSKGGMEEHVETILRRNLPLARELLLDGHLVQQGLLDRAKVEAALSGRPSTSSGYLLEIHDCIATEAWLQRIAGSIHPVAA